MKDNCKPVQETYNERMMKWPITEKSAGNKFHIVGWNIFFIWVALKYPVNSASCHLLIATFW